MMLFSNHENVINGRPEKIKFIKALFLKFRFEFKEYINKTNDFLKQKMILYELFNKIMWQIFFFDSFKYFWILN